MKIFDNKIVIILIVLCFTTMEAQDKSDYFQIGLYGLQSPVGTKGFQTGKLNEIKNEVNETSSNINASIAYRSWNRKKYPNWDFNEFVSNYMKDMYLLTKDVNGNSGIQVLTPNLYSVFADPVVSETIENDNGNDRYLSREVFKKFIFDILDEEFNIVKQEVKSDAKTIEILTNKYKRPLLGWYLDDEPLIRNHDISVIIEMAWYIRGLEKEFYNMHKVLSKFPNSLDSYYHFRYMAFDGDDLHKYKRSGRPEDAVFYNLNGKSISFAKNQIYTVFPDDVVDVLLIDFYKPDPLFWNKIINDVEIEYLLTQRVKPKIMPVIYTNFKRKSKLYNNKFYSNTFTQFKALDMDGVWIYKWKGSDSKVGAKDIWNSEDIKLKEIIRLLE